MAKTANLGLLKSSGQLARSSGKGPSWHPELDDNLDAIDAAIGTLQAAPAAPRFVDAEVPSGSANGLNTAFTLAHSPNPASSLQLFLNGVKQKAGVDFTLSGSSITYTVAPANGGVLEAYYRY
jgi:hypothetical protein